MPVFKVVFKKEFEIYVEAPSTAAIRRGFDDGLFPSDIDWGTGEWRMFSAGPVERPADHFLAENGDIRHIDDRKDHQSAEK